MKQENLSENPQKSADTLRKNEKIRRMVSQTLDRNSLNASKVTSENSYFAMNTINMEPNKILNEASSPVESVRPKNSIEITSKSENVAFTENKLHTQAPLPPKRVSKEPPLPRPRLRATETIESKTIRETIDFGEDEVEIFKKVGVIGKNKEAKSNEEIMVNGQETEVETVKSEDIHVNAEVRVNNIPDIVFSKSEEKLMEPQVNKSSVNLEEFFSDLSDNEEIEPIEIILIGSKSNLPKSEPIPIIDRIAPPTSTAIRNSPKASVSFKTDIETISSSSYSSLEDYVQSNSEFFVDLLRNDSNTPSQLKSILKPDDKLQEENDENDMFSSWVKVDQHRRQLDNSQYSKQAPPLPKTPPPALEDKEEFIFDDSPIPMRVMRESLI